MKKHEPIDIAKLLSKNKNPPQRVALLKHLAQIDDALMKGFTKKSIHKTLFDEDIISCNYSYFARFLQDTLQTEKANSTTEPEKIGSASATGFAALREGEVPVEKDLI